MSTSKPIKLISLTLVLAMFLQDFVFASPDLKPLTLPVFDSSANGVRKNLPSIPDSVATVEDSFFSEQSPFSSSSDPEGSEGESRSGSRVAASPLPRTRTLTHRAGSLPAGMLVYLVQDAHTNDSAQMNLARLLDLLIQKEKIPTVFAEGGVGNDSLSFLRKKAPLEKRKEVARAYVRKGILHGEEYLDLTSDHAFTIWGVDDAEAYVASLEAYRIVVKERVRFANYLDRVEQTIEALKPKIYNPKLLSFDETHEKFISASGGKEEISLTDYIEALSHAPLPAGPAAAAAHSLSSVPLPENKRSASASPAGSDTSFYPHLNILKDLKAFESKINFQKANEEQVKAILSLSQEDQKELLELSSPPATNPTGPSFGGNALIGDQHGVDSHLRENNRLFKLDAADHKAGRGFYALLEEKLMTSKKEEARVTKNSQFPAGDAEGEFSFRPQFERQLRTRTKRVPQAAGPAGSYPELFQYFSYLKLAKKINVKKILEELEALNGEVYDTLAQTPDERTLVQASNNVRILKKFVTLTLTPEEWAAYKKDPQSFSMVEIAGFLNQKIMDLHSNYERALFLEPGYETVMKQCVNFYELSERRDEAFVENMLTKLVAGPSDKSLRSPVVLITGGFHTPHLKELLKQRGISYLSLTPQVLNETNQKRYEDILLGQQPQDITSATGDGGRGRPVGRKESTCGSWGCQPAGPVAARIKEASALRHALLADTILPQSPVAAGRLAIEKLKEDLGVANPAARLAEYREYQSQIRYLKDILEQGALNFVIDPATFDLALLDKVHVVLKLFLHLHGERPSMRLLAGENLLFQTLIEFQGKLDSELRPFMRTTPNSQPLSDADRAIFNHLKQKLGSIKSMVQLLMHIQEYLDQIDKPDDDSKELRFHLPTLQKFIRDDSVNPADFHRLLFGKLADALRAANGALQEGFDLEIWSESSSLRQSIEKGIDFASGQGKASKAKILFSVFNMAGSYTFRFPLLREDDFERLRTQVYTGARLADSSNVTLSRPKGEEESHFRSRLAGGRLSVLDKIYGIFMRRAAKFIGKTQSRYFDSFDGEKIHYLVAGNPKARHAVVFLHGAMGDATHWLPQLPYLKDLARRYKLIFLDIRGYGLSEQGAQKDGGFIQAAARDVQANLEKEKISTVDIVGHSLGGMIAMKFFEENPTLVKHMVLLNTTPLPLKSAPIESRWFWTGLRLYLRAILCIPGLNLFGSIFEAGLRSSTTARWFFRNFLNRWILHGTPQRFFDRRLYPGALTANLSAIVQSWLAIFDFDGLSALSKINVPTLVVQGNQDMIVIPGKVENLFRSSGNKNIQVWPIEDVGHFVYAATRRDASRRLGQRVKNFLLNTSLEKTLPDDGARLASEKDMGALIRELVGVLIAEILSRVNEPAMSVEEKINRELKVRFPKIIGDWAEDESFRQMFSQALKDLLIKLAQNKTTQNKKTLAVLMQFTRELIEAEIQQWVIPNPAGAVSLPAIEVWDGKQSLTELLNDPKRKVVAVFGEPDDTGTVKNLGRPGNNEPDVMVREIFSQLKNRGSYKNLKIVYLGNIALPVFVPGDDYLIIENNYAKKMGATYLDHVEDSYQRVKEVVAYLHSINPDLNILPIGGENGYSYPHSYYLEGTTGLVAFDNHLDAHTLEPGGGDRRLSGPNSGTYLTLKLSQPHPGSGLDPKSVWIIGVDPDTEYYSERKAWLLDQGVPEAQIVTIEEVHQIQSWGDWPGFIRGVYAQASKNVNHVHAMFDIDVVEFTQAPGRSAWKNRNGPLDGQGKGMDAKLFKESAKIAGEMGVSLFDMMEVAPKWDASDRRTIQLAARSIGAYLEGLNEWKNTERVAHHIANGLGRPRQHPVGLIPANPVFTHEVFVSESLTALELSEAIRSFDEGMLLIRYKTIADLEYLLKEKPLREVMKRALVGGKVKCYLTPNNKEDALSPQLANIKSDLGSLGIEVVSFWKLDGLDLEGIEPLISPNDPAARLAAETSHDAIIHARDERVYHLIDAISYGKPMKRSKRLPDSRRLKNGYDLYRNIVLSTGENRSSASFMDYWRKTSHGPLLIKFLDQLFEKARSGNGFTASDTRVVFLSAGADPLYEMAKVMTGVAKVTFPSDRIHKVWATMGMLKAMRKDPAQKVLFIKYLFDEGILTSETKRIIFVDTDTRLSLADRNTGLFGTKILIYETLLDASIIQKANRQFNLDLPIWNFNSGHFAELFYMRLHQVKPEIYAGVLTKIGIDARSYDLRMKVESFSESDDPTEADLIGNFWLYIDNVAKLESVGDRLVVGRGQKVHPVSKSPYDQEFDDPRGLKMLRAVQLVGLILGTLDVLETRGYEVREAVDTRLGELRSVLNGEPLSRGDEKPSAARLADSPSRHSDPPRSLAEKSPMLATFFEGVARAQEFQGSRLVPVGRYLFSVHRQGRRFVAVPRFREKGLMPIIIQDTKVKRWDEDAIGRMKNQVNGTVRSHLGELLSESSRKRVLRVDMRTFENLSERSFEKRWKEILDAFEKIYSEEDILQVVSTRGSSARLKSVVKGRVVRKLAADVREGIKDGSVSLVNLVPVSNRRKDFKRPIDGRLLPMWVLKEGDEMVEEATVALSRAVADASGMDDMRSLSKAWQTLTGLSIPADTLWKLINNRAAFELIQTYALLSMIVDREIANVAFTQRATLAAA